MTAPPERAISIGSRAQHVLRDWRLLAALLAMCCMTVVAITAFSFSNALVTASSSSPGNVVTAGTLKMHLSETDQIVSGQDFGPGVTRQGNMTVTLLAGRGELYLSATHESGNTDLAGILDVTITQTDPGPAHQVYDEPLSDLYAVDLGSFWAPDQGPSAIPQVRVYEIQLHWPDDVADASHENETMSFTFDWHMVSS